MSVRESGTGARGVHTRCAVVKEAERLVVCWPFPRPAPRSYYSLMKAWAFGEVSLAAALANSTSPRYQYSSFGIMLEGGK